MAVPPLIAAKAAQEVAQRVSKALDGDMYVRRWRTTTGKGEDVKVVDHELHVNPKSLVVAGAAATAGVAVIGLGAYLMGIRAKVTTDGKVVQRIVDEYEPKFKEVKVIDVPYIAPVAAHSGTKQVEVPTYTRIRVDKNGMPQDEAEALGIHWVFDHLDEVRTGTHMATMSFYYDYEPGQAEVSHTVSVQVSAGKAVVMTNRFRPTGVYPTFEDALNKMQARYKNARNLRETRLAWVTVRNTKLLRHFMTFEADGATIGLDQGKQRGSVIDIGGSLF